MASTSPATRGQSITFTAIVAASVAGVPTGVVEFGSNGVVLGFAALNSSGVASFSFAGLPIGVNVIEAYYLGDAANAPGLSNFVAQGVLPTVALGGPTVTMDRVVSSHSVEVSFSRPLLRSTVKDRRNYAIIGPHGQALTIKSATYHATDDSVTLTTRQALEAGQSYRLMVNGVRIGRVVDLDRIPLGGKNGKLGTNFVGRITPKAPRAMFHASKK